MRTYGSAQQKRKKDLATDGRSKARKISGKFRIPLPASISTFLSSSLSKLQDEGDLALGISRLSQGMGPVHTPFIAKHLGESFLGKKLTPWKGKLQRVKEKVEASLQNDAASCFLKFPSPKPGSTMLDAVEAGSWFEDCVKDIQALENFGKPLDLTDAGMPISFGINGNSFICGTPHNPCACIPHWVHNKGESTVIVMVVPIDPTGEKGIENISIHDAAHNAPRRTWTKIKNHIHFLPVRQNESCWIPLGYTTSMFNIEQAPADLILHPHISGKVVGAASKEVKEYIQQEMSAVAKATTKHPWKRILEVSSMA